MTVQSPVPDSALTETMMDMGTRARSASRALGRLSADDRTRGLKAIAEAIRAAAPTILEANVKDMEAARKKGLDAAMLDRLALDEKRVDGIVSGVEAIAALPDPIGRELARWQQPNGLDFARVAVPLGVIGIIYESRPNVTADAGTLCLRSGNAAILRCGSESTRSSHALVDAMRAALKAEGLPENAIQLVGTTDREAVGHMLSGLDGQIDVIVPRGGKGLVAAVSDGARVPVIKHLDGICHVYIDDQADLEKAVAVALNAKTQRYGTCNTLETLLVHVGIADAVLPDLAARYREAGVELRGCERVRKVLHEIHAATEADWGTEYLAPILSIRMVDDLDAAMNHIAQYSSAHTESIITENLTRARRFLREVDSSSVMVNASTRFADGYEYGLGAEIGISTDKFHARGPVGLEGLTSQKWVVLGDGHVR